MFDVYSFSTSSQLEYYHRKKNVRFEQQANVHAWSILLEIFSGPPTVKIFQISRWQQTHTQRSRFVATPGLRLYFSFSAYGQHALVISAYVNTDGGGGAVKEENYEKRRVGRVWAKIRRTLFSSFSVFSKTSFSWLISGEGGNEKLVVHKS